jgi:hypothetical protein
VNRDLDEPSDTRARSLNKTLIRFGKQRRLLTADDCMRFGEEKSAAKQQEKKTKLMKTEDVANKKVEVMIRTAEKLALREAARRISAARKDEDERRKKLVKNKRADDATARRLQAKVARTAGKCCVGNPLDGPFSPQNAPTHVSRRAGEREHGCM